MTNASRTQTDDARIVQFLEHEAFEGLTKRIDTANAHVFLAGNHAYKIKRPVQFSFLDFSTREARRASLENELKLNRRTAPELYQRVVPITCDNGRLAINGEGETVEWVLVMKRFPDGALLSEIAAGKRLDRSLLEELAKAIVSFHRKAEVIDASGSEAIDTVISGNSEDLRHSIPEVFSEAKVDDLISRTRQEFGARKDLLEQRSKAGHLRHCHGDLHMANIVVLGGKPVLFDCIEFNDEFAKIDVLYDLAFLVMDLIEHEQPTAAQHLLNIYNDRTLSDSALALIPLFLSLRAAIRAKIEAFGDRGGDARRYLDLASAVLKPHPPRLVAIGGRSGTGKSTVALALAPDLGAAPGALVLRSDVIRKRQFGVEPTEKLPESAYTKEASANVYREIAERAADLLGSGRSVIADAVFGSPQERSMMRQVAEAALVPFHPIWLVADEDVLVKRVKARSGDASDADADIVRYQRNMDQANVEWPFVETSGDRKASIERVRSQLNLSARQ